jgi:hypothetical protein
LGFLRGGGDEDELLDEDDAVECGGELTKGAAVTFVLVTVATTALMTKKITDAFALGNMRKQVKTIEEVQIPVLLAEARALFDGGVDSELLRAQEELRREKQVSREKIEKAERAAADADVRAKEAVKRSAVEAERAAVEAERAAVEADRAAVEAKRADAEAELRETAEKEISVLRRRVREVEEGEKAGGGKEGAGVI